MSTTPANAQRRTPWANGIAAAAGAFMGLSGLMSLLQGIATVGSDSLIVRDTGNYIFAFDANRWGWIHLVVGALVLVAGFAILAGLSWARLAGICLAALAIVVNFMWAPLFPLWAILLIAINGIVIWALATHTPVDTLDTEL